MYYQFIILFETIINYYPVDMLITVGKNVNYSSE